MKKQAVGKIVIITVFVLALCAGVISFQLQGGFHTTQTRAEFEQIVESTNMDTRGSAFYQGRKEGYDYFKARWNVGSKNIRVPVSESPISDSFAYTTDQQKWRGGGFMNLNGVELSSAIEQTLGTEK